MQSLRSVAFVFLFARIAILDPALWIIVFNLLHFGRASKTFGNVVSEEQCNLHEVSLPPGHFQKDSFVGVRLLVELCHSLFLPWNYSTPQNGLTMLRNFPVKDRLFPVVRNICVFLISSLIGTPPECP